jgi:hypothetical protein
VSDTVDPKPSSVTGEHPVTAGELKHVVKVHDLRVIAGVLIAIITSSVGAWVMLQNEARAQANTVTVEVVRRLDNVERVQREHIEDSRTIHVQVRDSLHELQTDTRDLYKTITTGRPSPRLEQPIDGGN